MLPLWKLELKVYWVIGLFIKKIDFISTLLITQLPYYPVSCLILIFDI